MKYLTFILMSFISRAAIGQAPTAAASNLVLDKIKCNQFDVSWTSGNGMARVVFIKEGSAITDNPVNDTFYKDNTVFGLGKQMKPGNGVYCVYRGTGNKLTVTGLKNFTKYYAAVYEYNSKSGGVYEYLTSSFPKDDDWTKNIVANFFIAPSSKCANGNSFSFTNSSISDISPLTYKWNFGDGQSATTKDATHSYTAPGIYSVKLEAFASGCSTSTIINDTVHPHPVVNFILDNTKPKNDSVQCFYGNRFTFKNLTTLQDIGAGGASYMRYEWLMDSLIAVAHKADAAFTSPGLKTVKLVVISNKNCRDSISRVYKVLPRAIEPAKVSVSPKVMPLLNNKFTFTNNSLKSLSHKWYLTHKQNPAFRDSLFGNTVTYTFKDTGTYYINLRSDDSIGCIDQIKDSVWVGSPKVGIKQPELSIISVYPNPSKNGVFYFSELPPNPTLTIYNITGKELLHLDTAPLNSEINISGLGAGSYILSVWSQGVRYYCRLVVLQ